MKPDLTPCQGLKQAALMFFHGDPLMSMHGVPATGWVLLALALSVSCHGVTELSFPEPWEKNRRHVYSLVALQELTPLLGTGQAREAELASRLLLFELEKLAPFPVYRRLLRANEIPKSLGPGLSFEGRTIDGLITGRFGYYRQDASTWDRQVKNAGQSQGWPVFVRRTKLLLRLKIEFRDLRNNRVQLRRSFVAHSIVEGKQLEREAVLRNSMLQGVMKKLVLALQEEPNVQRRLLCPWWPVWQQNERPP